MIVRCVIDFVTFKLSVGFFCTDPNLACNEPNGYTIEVSAKAPGCTTDSQDIINEHISHTTRKSSESFDYLVKCQWKIGLNNG
jgi:hypothetical protein